MLSISQYELPFYLGFFQFTYSASRRGKALLGAIFITLVR